VAYIGLCAMDLPNMAKLKDRHRVSCLLAGYDLGDQTAEAIKSGTAQAAIGQHPYLQGYLPVQAMARHLKDKKPLPKGWIPIDHELVTTANLDDAVYKRETDEAAQTKWYADYRKKNFADLSKLVKPLPGKHE
jgi:ABC-type sugar transport system substrate-binding protein